MNPSAHFQSVGVIGPRRSRAILARWIDVLAYGAIVGLLWYAFAPAMEALCAPLVNFLASVALWPGVACWASVSCVLLWLVGSGRWMGLMGLRHPLSFPPLWFGIVFAALIAGTVNTLWPRNPSLTKLPVALIHLVARFSADHPWFIAAVGIAVLAIYVIKRRWSLHANAAGPKKDAAWQGRSDWKEQLQTFEGLKAWAQSDAEVAHPSHDLFNHDAIAERMARRLEKQSEGRVPTIANVGERGSGKSTIGRLVEHRLRSNPRMLFVRLSLWPFDSTDAAVRGILNELVRALGTRVNTLSLTGLPEEYAAAVEKLGPWATVLSLFRQPSNPKAIIERMDRIALAAGFRIVFWIEDLERFSAAATIEGESAALREEERLGPIRSLLWLLNECDRLGVVIADASLHSRFDVDKIARFVERVPPLGLDQAGNVLLFFRKECLNGYPKPIIDPAHPGDREEFKPSKAVTRSIQSYLSSDRKPEPFDALIDVIRTPRSLKNVLRWTFETWEQFPGEIDLDHVIAASALRSSYPEIFAFIESKIDSFRRGFRTAGSDGNAPMQHKDYLAFEELLERPPFQGASAAIRSLVRFIFPAFPQDRESPDIDRQYLLRPQGLNIKPDWDDAEPVDYWSRYLTCASIPDDRSDQRALRQIEAWKNGEEGDLVSDLIENNHNRQIERFLKQFRFSDLLRLLTEVAGREASEGIKGWSNFQSPPGGVSLWRMLRRCGVYDSARVAHKLEELFESLVPVHLPYAWFLLHYYCEPDRAPTIQPLTDTTDTTRLSEFVRERLLRVFRPGNASALLSALHGAHPYLLRHLLADIKRGCGSQGDLPIEGWKELSGILLELAELRPPIGIPIILAFVTEGDDRVVDLSDPETGEHSGPRRVTEYQFEKEKAERLFGLSRLRSVLADQRIPDDIDSSIREMWQAAKDALQGGS